MAAVGQRPVLGPGNDRRVPSVADHVLAFVHFLDSNWSSAFRQRVNDCCWVICRVLRLGSYRCETFIVWQDKHAHFDGEAFCSHGDRLNSMMSCAQRR